MIKQIFYTSFLFFLLYKRSSAQTIAVTDIGIPQSYSFVHPVFNRIQNPGGLDSFYLKLYRVKTMGQGVVSIVHIGDSHIQADYLPAVVRNGLQEFFGNAGRGLVFPYQLAQSNAPPDIHFSSNIRWQFNRLAHPEIAIACGISGYGIRTRTEEASIDFSLKPGDQGSQMFNRLKFFFDHNEGNSWQLRAENNDSSFVLKNENDSMPFKEIVLKEKAGGFSLSCLPPGNTKDFYGVSLENSGPGVLYHTIGVNGARFDHYNNAALFWQQLGALQPDLFIVSLGTNEAQAASFNEPAFRKEFLILIDILRKVSSRAAILITTPADSYKRRKPNAVLKQINSSLASYCNQYNIPFLDIYRVTNGYGSAYSWSKRGLMNRDRIHFTAEGYRIQGNLLLSALAKGYNSFSSNPH